MKKKEYKSVLTGVLFCASLIILVYVMLEFRSVLPVLIGAAFFFLVMTGISIYQVCIAMKIYQKKQTMLLESRLAQMQNQIAAASEETVKASQTNTYYTKKIGEALAGFEDELIDNQRKCNMLMQRMITAQTKSTKVLVKYNQINTNKVVSNVSHQYEQIEHSLDNSMSNTNIELRKIGENIMMIQKSPLPAAYQLTPEMPSQMAAAPQNAVPTEAAPEDVMHEPPIPESQPPEETISDALLDSVEIPPLTEETEVPDPEEISAPSVEIPDDPNATLSADQIAALFAAANG